MCVLESSFIENNYEFVVHDLFSPWTGWSYSEIYSSTKFAVEGFFESLAAAARSFNIRYTWGINR